MDSTKNFRALLNTLALWTGGPFGWLFFFGLALIGQILMVQRSYPITLYLALFFFGAAIFFFFRWIKVPPSGLSGRGLPGRYEALLLLLILALALFLRLYRINEIPSGIGRDEACQGWVGFQIAHSNWRPFSEVLHYLLPDGSVNMPAYRGVYFNAVYLDAFYGLAAWFTFFPADRLHFCLFFISISMVSLGLIYWLFRQLASPSVSLTALFILSVMQWPLTMSRNGHPAIIGWLYIFGCLSFLLYGFRAGKLWAFVAAGMLGSGCFYGYTSVRVLPLLLFLCFLHQWKYHHLPGKKSYAATAVFGAFFLLGAAPVLLEMLRFRFLINPNFDSLFIGHEMWAQKSLLPLFRNIFQGLLLFNREGDNGSLHNIPHHRLFDDVTGILWILGFAYSLSRITQRASFYALSGFFIFLLPCVLATAPFQISRCLDAAPFAALLAALFLEACRKRLEAGSGGAGRLLWKIAFVTGALLILFENSWIYFRERPRNEDCWRFPDIEANLAAREISSLGNTCDYYLSSRFFQNYVVMLLANAQGPSIHELDMPDSFEPISGWDGRGLMFVLEEGRTGWLGLLEDLYPGGQAQDLLDLEGKPILHFYKVSPQQRYQARGLTGPETGQVPEFPLRLPQKSRPYALAGSFLAPQTGLYRFCWRGDISVRWRLDGKPVFPNQRVHLVRGFYPVRFQCSLPQGAASMALSQAYENEAYLPLGPEEFVPRILPPGLLGVYRISCSWDAAPCLVQKDLLLNFSFHNDFPVKTFPPLSVSWTGNLRVPSSGPYHFLVLTTDWATLKIDGKLLATANEDKELFLNRGPHALEVRFQKQKGVTASLHFLWETPGRNYFEVVPYKVYGSSKD